VAPLLVTVVSTTAGDPAGDVAVIWVLLLTVYDVAFAPPNCTLEAPLTPVKPAPVMTTDVPPPAGPDAGDTPLMVGRKVK
jgi:hypothetical protein